MEKINDPLLQEQQKTNALLTQLVTDQAHKMKQETRRFWLNLIWHSIPIILTAIFAWQLYTYIQTQVGDLQLKFSKVQTDLGTLNFGDRLRSLLNQ